MKSIPLIKRRRRKRRPSLDTLRLFELRKIAACRYPTRILPETPPSRTMLKAMLVHVELGVGAERRLEDFALAWAPWLKAIDLRELVNWALVAKRPSADRLGWDIKLSAIDRTTLSIRTIGAYDQPKPQRVRKRRDRAKARETARRRAKGVKPRAEYEASSLTRIKPWTALGISRRTWERRRKA